MKAGFCLLIQLFVQNAQSEPDTNVHVYIPQEQRPEQQPEQQEQQPDTHHHVYVPPEQHGGKFSLVHSVSTMYLFTGYIHLLAIYSLVIYGQSEGTFS